LTGLAEDGLTNVANTGSVGRPDDRCPPPTFVSYGDAAEPAPDPAVLGTRGAHLGALVALGAPVPAGLTVPVATSSGLRSRDTASAAVERVLRASGVTIGASSSDGAVSLLRLWASAPVEVAGLPPRCVLLGLTPDLVDAVVGVYGDADELYCSWVETLRMVAEHALAVPAEEIASALLEHRNPRAQVEALYDLCLRVGNGPFPGDVPGQVAAAATAMHARWAAPRAQRARRSQSLPSDLGLALHLDIQRIGTRDATGHGRATSRDLVSGRFGPVGSFALGLAAAGRADEPQRDLSEIGVDVSALAFVLRELETRHSRAASVSFEFAGPRLAVLGLEIHERTSARATTTLAVDLAAGGVIDHRTAVQVVRPEHVEELLHPQVVLTGDEQLLVRGLPASPGAASGSVALSSDHAVTLAASGTPVVLVAAETTPADLPGMLCAAAIVTVGGGMASHAAVVARGIGRPAVCGAAALSVDTGRGEIASGDLVVREGETISVNGSVGDVYVGAVTVREVEASAELTSVLSWSDSIRRLGVRANADTGPDTKVAIRLGAEGIGLCRTEHQFLGERLPLIRRVILAADADAEQAALEALAAAQREDFQALLLAVGDRPVTVRLLDAPMHEFMPSTRDDADDDASFALAMSLSESNPMLGVRGVRLALIHEGLYPAQVSALFTAWVDVARDGIRPQLEVMVPLVSLPSELAHVAALIRRAGAEVSAATGIEVPYRIGTMVETPRAALMADRLVRDAEFLSFGTNDLTQLTYGFSRDDVERRVLQPYIEQGMLSVSPFTELDPDGVGALIEIAVSKARSVRPDVKLGLCGEHGGNPASIALSDRLGLDYVSCSPHRVPVARLAAAHAQLNRESEHER
jgi:pyruvate,orthophosphate dikinase